MQALLGYNLGVEMGQAAIIALLAPLIALLRPRPFFARYAIPACASFIFIAGSWWFVQRAFLL